MNLSSLSPANKRETGFSLIEVLVSIVIIGILAAIAIPMFTEQRKTALRQEIRSDVLNTAANLSQWQTNKEDYAPIPTTAEKAKLIVKTNSATTIDIQVNNASVNQELREFCVIGSRDIGGVYTISYSLTTKETREGACSYLPTPDPENYE